MNNWFNRLNVVLSVASFQNTDCPYCQSKNTKYLGKNAPVSHIRECNSCGLIYRWPKQDESFNTKFYQKLYSKFHKSPVTDLPSEKQIEEFKKNNFQNSPRDFTHYTRLLKYLGCKSVIDYGCSWGYGAYQFANSGLLAHGLEISLPRAEFGRRALGVKIFNSTEEVLRQELLYDAIFTSHVLEHLPTPRIAFSFF